MLFRCRALNIYRQSVFLNEGKCSNLESSNISQTCPNRRQQKGEELSKLVSLLSRSLMTAEKKRRFLAALRVYCLSLTQMSACRKVSWS